MILVVLLLGIAYLSLAGILIAYRRALGYKWMFVILAFWFCVLWVVVHEALSKMPH